MSQMKRQIESIYFSFSLCLSCMQGKYIAWSLLYTQQTLFYPHSFCNETFLIGKQQWSMSKTLTGN